MERIVSDQLLEYLTENELLDPCQFAYRRNSSTQTCIIRMLDDVRQAAVCRKMTISIFFDFSKAFDRVHHGVLIKKLQEMGLSSTALCWVAAYLMNRMHAVRDGFEGVISSLAHIKAGVPQGSVSGPLLFTIYVSDIGNVLHHCKYNFYVDDLQIYLHCEPSNLQNGILKVNEDIKSIVHWAGCNGLTLNSAKTQVIIFGTARYINTIELDRLPAISIDGSAIQLSTYVKYLGVTVSNTLSWNLHVDNVVKNIRTKLYQLKLSKSLLPKDLKIRLIVSLIFPHLDYCCAAFTDITDQLNVQLYRALNACIRFAFNVRWDEHLTPFYGELRWLKIDARRKYFVGCLLFNIICTQQPSLIYGGITLKSAVTSRTTSASGDLLSLPLCRTEIFRRSFKVSASKLWNDLPLDIRCARSTDDFKCKLYEHLLSTMQL